MFPWDDMPEVFKLCAELLMPFRHKAGEYAFNKKKFDYSSVACSSKCDSALHTVCHVSQSQGAMMFSRPQLASAARKKQHLLSGAAPPPGKRVKLVSPL